MTTEKREVEYVVCDYCKKEVHDPVLGILELHGTNSVCGWSDERFDVCRNCLVLLAKKLGSEKFG